MDKRRPSAHAEARARLGGPNSTSLLPYDLNHVTPHTDGRQALTDSRETI